MVKNGEKSRLCASGEMPGRFRQCDIQCAFTRGNSGEKELKAESGLARAGIPLNEVKVPGGKTAMKNVIKSGNSGFQACFKLTR